MDKWQSILANGGPFHNETIEIKWLDKWLNTFAYCRKRPILVGKWPMADA